MQLKQPAFASLVALAVCTMFALSTAAQDKKVNPTGTWTWNTPGRDGGEPRPNTLKLKVEGEKVTGTLASAGRQGGQPREIKIEDGTLKGDELSFKVTREFGGNQFVIKYTGKVTAKTITGKTEMPGRDGGEPRSREWEAKRVEAKK